MNCPLVLIFDFSFLLKDCFIVTNELKNCFSLRWTCIWRYNVTALLIYNKLYDQNLNWSKWCLVFFSFYEWSPTDILKYTLVFNIVCVVKFNICIGPILDDRLKEKLLKPWKSALCSHFRVCFSVCFSVRELLITVFDLGT